MRILKQYWQMIVGARTILFVLALLMWLFPLSSTVHADGGAPNLAYVSGASHGISVIDISLQQVTRTLTVDGDPHTIQLSLDGRFLYVTQPTLGRVSVLSAQTGDTICSVNLAGKPSLLALDTNTNMLYSAGNADSSVTALDADTCAVQHTFKTAGPVHGLAIAVVGSSIPNSNGNQLWVANGNALSVFDDVGGQQLSNFSVPGQPEYISIPPGVTVYVTTGQGEIYAIDLNTKRVIKLLSGGVFGPMDYDANTGKVYVPDQKHNQLDVLAPINASAGALPQEPAGIIPLGITPESIAITSDGQLGFAALSTGSVAMLDIPGKVLLATILVGGSPHFVITGLKPPLLGTTPQQASIWNIVRDVAAYVFVIVLLVVPILLFRRYSRSAFKQNLK